MYCPNCKNKILEGTATCHFCGQDLSKLRKVKLADVEEDDRPLSNVNLDRGQIRDALTYDPFKEKVKYHLLFSSLIIILGLGMLVVTFVSLGLFSGALGTALSIVAIILLCGGFIYAIISIILFIK